jgi:hypothetical protein
VSSGRSADAARPVRVFVAFVGHRGKGFSKAAEII